MKFADKQTLGWGALAVAICALLSIFLYWNLDHVLELIIASALSVFILYSLYFVLFKELRKYYKGSAGEHNVKRALKKLPKSFSFRQNLLLYGLSPDVDFVCIGPTGVWAIEVKDVKGEYTCVREELYRNEKLSRGFASQANSEAIDVEQFLKKELDIDIPVQPIVVLTDIKAKLDFKICKTSEAFIVDLPYLRKVIREGLGKKLSKDLAKKISDLIKAYN
jgi:hypothetical protein